MPYDKKIIYKEALELSQKMGFFFVQDIIDYLRVSHSTFYDFFPAESDELDAIKANLYKNKIQQKISLRKKMSDGRGSDIIALYKLIGNDDERKALSTNWQKNEHSGDIKTSPIIIKLGSDDYGATQ